MTDFLLELFGSDNDSTIFALYDVHVFVGGQLSTTENPLDADGKVRKENFEAKEEDQAKGPVSAVCVCVCVCVCACLAGSFTRTLQNSDNFNQDFSSLQTHKFRAQLQPHREANLWKATNFVGLIVNVVPHRCSRTSTGTTGSCSTSGTSRTTAAAAATRRA